MYECRREDLELRHLEGYFNSPTDYEFTGVVTRRELINTPVYLTMRPGELFLDDTNFATVGPFYGDTDLTFNGVPEPGAAALMLLGLVGIMRRLSR